MSKTFEPLVCKVCGYKQYDEETVKYYTRLRPDKEPHDIDYVCGACALSDRYQEKWLSGWR